MSGGGSAVIDGTYLFSYDDGDHGLELWRSDGTEAGTVLVKDIRPGKETSDLSDFCELNGLLYFQADDGVHGAELWRSDGTAEGTFIVADANPGEHGIFPRNIHRLGAELFFESALGGNEPLWKSDGTAAGTVRLSQLSSLSPATIVGENSTAIFFVCSNVELWRTDGTDQGTFRLIQAYSPELLGKVGETLYFSGVAQWLGPKGLWKTDGTVAGTSFITNVDAQPTWGSEGGIALGATFLFTANDPVHGAELWKTDGTETGTILLKDIRPAFYPGSTIPARSEPRDFVVANGSAYFLVNDAQKFDKYELWKSDGTEAGTLLVKQFSESSATIINSSLAAVDGAVYFSVRDASGNALWKSDGTETGTIKIKTFNAGPYGEYSFRGAASPVRKVGDSIVFFADDQNYGDTLWRTDGTEAGTVLVKDLLSATADSDASRFTPVGALTYFTANDGMRGEELWVSDGTSGGTRLVKDIAPGLASSRFDRLINVNGTLYFAIGNNSSHGAIWKSDGTEAGTVLVRGFANPRFHIDVGTFANVGDTLYFSMLNYEAGDTELWKSDGTEAGTTSVFRFVSNQFDGPITEMTDVNGTLFFSAWGESGRELYKSDGTSAGTVLVKNINTGYSDWYGPDSSAPESLVEFNGLLYFIANSSGNPRRLWRSDGTREGTVEVQQNALSGYGDWLRFLVEVDDTLFFEAEGWLWKSDGTDAGTVAIKSVRNDLDWYGWLNSMSAADGKLYLSVTYSTFEARIWETDGTEEGTRVIGVGSPDGAFSKPGSLLAWDGDLYFTALSRYDGVELHRIDEAGGGVQLVRDFNESFTNSLGASNPLTLINGKLAIVTTTTWFGNELWIAEPDAPTLPGDYDGNGRVDGGDFLAWQRGFGGSATPAGSGADGDASGGVDAADLAVWKEHFGAGADQPTSASSAVVAPGDAAESDAIQPAATTALGLRSEPVESTLAATDSVSARGLVALAQAASDHAKDLPPFFETAKIDALRRDMHAERSQRRLSVAEFDAAFTNWENAASSQRWRGGGHWRRGLADLLEWAAGAQMAANAGEASLTTGTQRSQLFDGLESAQSR